MRSISSTKTFWPRRSYSFVVRLSACPAIRCATSSVPPFSRKLVIPVALKEWGENASDNSGVFEPAFEHSGCIDSGHRAVPEFSCLTQRNRKEGCGWPIFKTRCLQILVKKLLQFVDA